MKPGPAKRAYMREWRKRHLERLRAIDRARYPAEAERRKRNARRWYAENTERARATGAAWAARNSEKQNEYGRARNARQPGRNRVYEQSRRARQREQFVEQVEHSVVWERDEGICGICGEAAEQDNWQLDHIIPLNQGGEHSYANTQVSHESCNKRKRDRVPSLS